MTKRPVFSDGPFYLEILLFPDQGHVQYTVYFPLTCKNPHTIKMFYFSK